MTCYSFQITNGEKFTCTEDLPSDDAAWHEAVLTVRDIESSLTANGGEWLLEVKRGDVPLYRINVSARKVKS